MIGCLHFILREYLSRTHVLPELILCFIGFLAFIGQEKAEIKSTILIFSIFISCLCFNRLYTRWKGSTRDIYVLALGKSHFALSIALAALAISSTCAFLFTAYLLYASGDMTAFIFFLNVVLQIFCCICLTYIMTHILHTFTNFPAVIGIMLSVLGFFSILLPYPYHLLGLVFPMHPQRALWLSALLALAYGALLYRLATRYEVADYQN